MSGKIVLVDGNSLIHRAFYALPLLDNGQGVYTNAAFGFFSMVFKALKDEMPDMLAVAFDMHEPTFRHEQYDEYKAGRKTAPDELYPQFELVQDILEAMSVKILSCPRYEADDMLGTTAAKLSGMGIESIIVTGDRDAFQLVGPLTTVLFTHKGISETDRVNEAYLMQRYSLSPERMIDLKGLMGDSSDNIPGIPGVGEKTALKLLAKYGSLDEAIKRGPVEEKGKLAEKLRDFAPQAIFSRKLATIDTNAPIEINTDELKIRDMAAAIPILEKYRMKTLVTRLNALPDYMKGNGAVSGGDNVFAASTTPEYAPPSNAEDGGEINATRSHEASSSESGIIWRDIAALNDAGAIARWAGETDGACAIAFDDAGCSLARDDGSQARVEIGRDMLSNGVTPQSLMSALLPIWQGGGRKLVVGLKRMLGYCDALPGGEVYDVTLADYAINAKYGDYSLDAILYRYETQPSPGQPSPARDKASLLFDVERLQRLRMEEDGITKLYEDIELPLGYVLHSMEKTGFLVDVEVLKQLGDKYKSKIARLTEGIYISAGREFNINSPKQLGEILFDEMKLPGGKKTARGYSTTADILESISDRHEIIPMILEYRKYFKFNNTYIDALLRLRGVDGRIHTSFDQTATATGRISSNEPNLQNIPVRTEEGREIRRAFVAREGHLLIDCDYSQIELRILAHLSGDERLIDAFRNGRDIHRATAADVYNVSIDDVTPAMRSAVKAVNFGIIYGISDFGLAKSIGTTRAEAAQFIRRYFEKYPGVRKYMDDMIALGKSQGYVTTVFGRRRYLEEMKSSNRNVRAFADRVALNSPIQGTSADIIKLAMIKCHKMLNQGGFKAKLILQVHDELIIEAPEDEADSVGRLLVEAMESSAKLSVPLAVDMSKGRNWHECKE
ncbi:MAG: DNA polymerase I [Clostridia bacterium]|nr:DNA polymerase I [Clostridia bacterium]